MRNKLLKTIIATTLGLSMAVGAGAGVASNVKAKPVYATDSTTTYTFTSKSWAATSGESSANWTSGKDGNQMQSGRGVQVTTGASGASASSPTSFTDISQIVITYSTNANNGAGSISMKIGTNDAESIDVTKSGGTTDRTLSWDYSPYQTGSVSFTVTCTTNSIYIKSIAITTTSSGGDPEPAISFSEDSISGEVGDDFSFTWTEQDLEDPIAWSPVDDDTDVIDYEVNADTKTVSGTLQSAGEVTLTATSGSASDSITFTVVEHQVHRKYTVTSKTTVSQSGDTITGATPTYSQTYSTASQATSGNSMTLSITGLTRKVIINKLVLSMHSNQSTGAGSISVGVDGKTPSFIAGTSSSEGVGFDEFGDNDSYVNSYRDVTWDNLDYTAKSSIEIKIYCITTNSLYCQSFDIFFEEVDNDDIVTALTVSPNSWTGFDSQTLDVSAFTISVTTNGETGSSLDYSFQGIGYMDGETFVARDANFTSGNPTVDDTRLCWKAIYPTEIGGSTYIYAYVTLNVSHDGISTIELSGDMTKTTYFTTDSWDETGLIVKAVYASGNKQTVTENLSFSFFEDAEMTSEIEAPGNLGVINNKTVYVKAVYSSNLVDFTNAEGYQQTVSVIVEPGTVENDPLSVDRAIEIGSELASKGKTAKQYYIRGIVNEVETNELGSANHYATFSFVDSDPTCTFKGYQIQADENCENYTDLKVGAEVLIKTKIYKYSNTIIENDTDGRILSIAAPVLAGISLNKNELSLQAGETDTLTVSPTNLGAEVGEVTWSTSNSRIARVNNGVVTAVAKGNATITAEAGGFEASCSVNVTSIAGTGMIVANSISIGDVVYLAAESAGNYKKQLSGISGSSTKYGAVVDYDDAPDTDVAPLTVVAGNQENTFALKLGNNYLKWSSGNSLTTESTLSDNSSWSITISDGNASIVNYVKDGENDRTIRYNSNDTRFACYKTGQADVQLWKEQSINPYLVGRSTAKLNGVETAGGVESLSIRFGGTITKANWDSIDADWKITDYGVMLVRKTTLDGYGYSSIKEAFDHEKTLSVFSKGSTTTPTNNNGYYSFSVKLSYTDGDSSEYDTVFCAAPFIVAGGEYYFLEEMQESVRTLIDKGMTSLSDSAIASL